MRHRPRGWLARERARAMRRDPTPAEYRLWPHLRRRALGYHFRRQEPIGEYIVDYVCWERRLVIELDGQTHTDQAADEVRDRALQELGFRVLRFWNDDIYERIDDVVEAIARALREAPSGSGSA